jgi:hypothetical protein
MKKPLSIFYKRIKEFSFIKEQDPNVDEIEVVNPQTGERKKFESCFCRYKKNKDDFLGECYDENPHNNEMLLAGYWVNLAKFYDPHIYEKEVKKYQTPISQTQLK